MKTHYRTLAGLMVISTLFLAACNEADTQIQPDENRIESAAITPLTVNPNLQFTVGTFTATTNSFGGQMSVETTFSSNTIESVVVLSHVDSPNFAELPVQRIPSEIVQYQSLDIDTITGATITSLAILNGVVDTINQANGDVDLLRTPRIRNVNTDPITIETEILVVGSGIAGLASSIAAASYGADVLVIEKLGLLGGTSSTSAGIIQGANTPFQQALGIEDNAYAFAEFMMDKAWGEADPDMINHIAHTSAENIKWLMEMGVEFQDEMHDWHYRFRPMRAIWPVTQQGYSITMYMVKHAESMGVEFMKETPALSLIVENGSVIGVNAVNRHGAEVTIYADAVILATGGFQFNSELMAEHLPLISNPFARGTIGSTGDGLIMGIEAGADTVMRGVPIGRMGPPVLPGIVVGPSGLRFMDESGYSLSRPAIMVSHGYAFHYNIMDASMLDSDLERSLANGSAVQADTIEELATLIDIDPSVLVATVNRYNLLAEQGRDDDFNKPSQHLLSVVEAPFFALLFDRYDSITGTVGGLKIDLYGRVIDLNGDPILGLFAAGEVANGQFFVHGYPGSGAALTSYTAMGRLTGRTAATENR